MNFLSLQIHRESYHICRPQVCCTRKCQILRQSESEALWFSAWFGELSCDQRDWVQFTRRGERHRATHHSTAISLLSCCWWCMWEHVGCCLCHRLYSFQSCCSWSWESWDSFCFEIWEAVPEDMVWHILCHIVLRGRARWHGVTDTMPYHRHCRVFSEVDFDNFSGEAKNFFLNKDCFIINCLYKVS